MTCSIKGNVKGNTPASTGRGEDFLGFQPLRVGRYVLLWSDLASSPFSMAYLCDATTPIGLRNGASVLVVRRQPWFYLRLVAPDVHASRCTLRLDLDAVETSLRICD
jgi:hypothetical protein